MRHSVAILTRAFFDLCVFRKGPQDLPVSGLLMKLALFLNLCVSLVVSLLNLRLTDALVAAVIDTALLWGFAVLLLRLFNLPRRVTQTVTALAGAGAVLSLCALPIILWLTAAHRNHIDATVPSMLWLVMFSWSLLVIAHILRNSLNSGFLIGLILAMLFVFIDIQIVSVLMPRTEGL